MAPSSAEERITTAIDNEHRIAFIYCFVVETLGGDTGRLWTRAKVKDTVGSMTTEELGQFLSIPDPVVESTEESTGVNVASLIDQDVKKHALAVCDDRSSHDAVEEPLVSEYENSTGDPDSSGGGVAAPDLGGVLSVVEQSSSNAPSSVFYSSLRRYCDHLCCP